MFELTSLEVCCSPRRLLDEATLDYTEKIGQHREGRVTRGARFEHGRLVVSLAMLAVVTAGCYKKNATPEHPVVTYLEVNGVHEVDEGEVLDNLATRDGPRLLGLWQGISNDYPHYDKEIFARDKERLLALYRRRGFFEARLRSARVEPDGKGGVRVVLDIDEGEPVHMTHIDFLGITQMPSDVAAAAAEVIELQPGDALDLDKVEETQRELQRTLQDAGYAYATVSPSVDVDEARHEARVSFIVQPGAACRYGKVTIEGLGELPEEPVRRRLSLEPGQPYRAQDLREAEAAVTDLGVFARVEVKPDLSDTGNPIVPIRVSTKGAHLRTLVVGLGVQLDSRRLSGDITFGWEHRNFLGGLRRLTVQTSTGTALFPLRLSYWHGPVHFFLESTSYIEIKQPTLFDGRTSLTLREEYQRKALLLSASLPLPGEPVIGFHDITGLARLERRFLNRRLRVAPSYQYEQAIPFAYLGQPNLDSVLVTYPRLFAEVVAKNPDSGNGVAVTLGAEAAGAPGDASDIKLDEQLAVSVPIGRRVNLFTRVRLGQLFPRNYGGSLIAQPRDQELMLFRAFYSGGADSNRGYGYREVGPHGRLAFLTPTSVCPVEWTTPACFKPLGGMRLWEASLELRVAIVPPWVGAWFVDASDVTLAGMRLSHPHLSTGLGTRIPTPVGLARIDLGFRVPYMQVVGEPQLPLDEGQPSTFLKLPIALHLSVGQTL